MTEEEISRLKVGDLLEPNLDIHIWDGINPFKEFPNAYPVKVIKVKPKLMVKFKDGEISGVDYDNDEDTSLKAFKLVRKPLMYWIKRMAK